MWALRAHRAVRAVVWMACAASAWAGAARAAEDCHPPGAQERARYARSLASYRVPAVDLLNQKGERIGVRQLLEADGPVALNFIFTTCATICPVMTATFSAAREALGNEADGLRMVSISIDPDHDTPRVLEEYARRTGAGDSWQFLTGDPGQIGRLLEAFDAATVSKMDHRPLTFLRAGPGRPWLRIEGLLGASDLLGEIRRLSAQ